MAVKELTGSSSHSTSSSRITSLPTGRPLLVSIIFPLASTAGGFIPAYAAFSSMIGSGSELADKLS